MNAELTELVFILDRSGSMGGLESDTIGGFNGMIEVYEQVMDQYGKFADDIHIEKRYPCSARSGCFAPIFCPTMVAVAEPMALEGRVIRPLTLLPIP